VENIILYFGTNHFSDIGDLILFKYDSKHRVAPCNPKDDLVFDVNGRSTAIMPIY